jgi:hypothetical protein
VIPVLSGSEFPAHYYIHEQETQQTTTPTRPAAAFTFREIVDELVGRFGAEETCRMFADGWHREVSTVAELYEVADAIDALAEGEGR